MQTQTWSEKLYNVTKQNVEKQLSIHVLKTIYTHIYLYKVYVYF